MTRFEVQAEEVGNGWLMMVPKDFKAFTNLQDILISQNVLNEVNIVSQLAMVK